MTPADRQILDEALGRLSLGDRSAFPVVYALCRPQVRAVARGLLGAGPDAEDAAQQALMKVFENASVYDRSRPGLPWILGIAAWECRTTRSRRRRSREELRAILPEPGTQGRSPEQQVIHRDLHHAIERVMGTLRPADRETIEVVLEQRGRPDIKAATFRKRLQRALERMRSAWEEHHDLP